MSSHIDVLGSAAFGALLVMIAAWLMSLVRSDASVVDTAWGLGFVVVGWVSWSVGDGLSARSDLLVAMVSIWGLRLAAHLWIRGQGRPEDFRYTAMRQRHGSRFAIRSLFTVFFFQWVVLLVVASPIMVAMTPTAPEVGWLAVVGVLVWGVGFFFETVGDAQLARFLDDPTNANRVMDQGLWRYTRHPNYFGDCCVWWGLWLVTAETVDARWAVIGPLLMTYLLVRVSGIPSIERGIEVRRPAYAAYAQRTSAFIPRKPRTEASAHP